MLCASVLGVASLSPSTSTTPCGFALVWAPLGLNLQERPGE